MGILHEGGAFFMKWSGDSVNWLTFLMAFDSQFWLVLMSVSFGFAVALYIIFLAKREKTISLMASFATVCLSFLALPVPVNANRVPARILVFTVCMTGALVFWAYNAVLISLLTVAKNDLPINSLADLAASPSYSMILLAGTYYVDYFKLAAQGSDAATIWQRMQEDETLGIFNTREEVEERLMKDSRSVFYGSALPSSLQFENLSV